MAKVVIVGAGMCGLRTALLLAATVTTSRC